MTCKEVSDNVRSWSQTVVNRVWRPEVFKESLTLEIAGGVPFACPYQSAQKAPFTPSQSRQPTRPNCGLLQRLPYRLPVATANRHFCAVDPSAVLESVVARCGDPLEGESADG